MDTASADLVLRDARKEVVALRVGHLKQVLHQVCVSNENKFEISTNARFITFFRMFEAKRLYFNFLNHFHRQL